MILDSLFLALVLSTATGPVFFLIVQLAVERGFWPASALAAGVWLSDILYISLVFLGLSFVSDNPNFTFYVGLIGGIILILFGLLALFSKPKAGEKKVLGAKGYLLLFGKGMAVNVFNPFVFVFWIGVVGRTIEKGYSISERILYFFILLFTVALLDEIKIYFSEKIFHKIKAKHLLWFGRISGLALIGFGIAMLVRIL